MIEHPPSITPRAAAASIASRRRWLRFAAALGALVLVGIAFLAVNPRTELGMDTDLRPLAGPEKSLRRIPMEVAYASPDAALVAFVDVRRVTESAFGRTLVSLPRLSEGRASLLAETGIDVSTDVDSLMVVAGRSSTRGRPLLIARGRFNPASRELLVQKRVAVAEEHANVRIVTHGDIAVAYAAPDLALIGPPAAVRSAIDIEATRSGIANHADVMRLMAARRHDAAWLVARATSFAERDSTRPSVGTSIQSTEWLVASGDVAGTLRGVVQAEAESDESARDLRSTTAGLITLGKLRWRSNVEIARALDSLNLSLDGKSVFLAFQLSAQLVEEVLVSSPPLPTR